MSEQQNTNNPPTNPQNNPPQTPQPRARSAAAQLRELLSTGDPTQQPLATTSSSSGADAVFIRRPVHVVFFYLSPSPFIFIFYDFTRHYSISLII